MAFNMKTKWKYLLFIGLGSVIVGGTLLAVGMASGGLEAIKKTTEPSTISQTFDDIDTINLSAFNRVKITSGDVKKVTVKHHGNSKFVSTVTVTKKDKELSINEEFNGPIITGPMEVGGYVLNTIDRRHDYKDIEVIVPKDYPLSNINNNASPGSYQSPVIELSELKVKEVNIGGTVSVTKTTIDSGIISFSSYSSFSESTIKNVTLNFGNLYMFKTILENATVPHFVGNLEAASSTIKNISLESDSDLYRQSIEGMADAYGEVDYNAINVYEYGDTHKQLVLEDSTLENMTYKGSGEILSKNTKLVGNINLEGYFIGARFNLNDKGEKTAITTDIQHGNLEVYDEIVKKSPIKVNDTNKQLQHHVQDGTATITIKATHGSIYFGEEFDY